MDAPSSASSAVKGIFGGAAVLGVLTMLWEHIKVGLHKVFALAFVTMTFDHSSQTMLTFFVMRKLPRSRFGDLYLGADRKFVKPVGRFIKVIYETVGNDPMVCHYGRVPILFRRQSLGEHGGTVLKMVFLRGTLNSDAFIKEVEQFYNKYSADGLKGNRRFQIHRCYGLLGNALQFRPKQGKDSGGSVYDATAAPNSEKESWLMGRIIGWRDDEIGEGQAGPTAAMTALAYPPEIEEVYRDIERWKQSESWYKSRSIAWRKGCLFHGLPGTGKSVFVRATGMDLDMPIFILDIATMTNEDFVEAWEKALAQAPAIVLLEDFDAVFEGRQRVEEIAGGLTFDCLLSRIAGVENSDGVVLFITTNNRNKIDSAIGQVCVGGTTRPGRIDMIVEFKALGEGERRRLACRILKDMDAKEIENAVIDGEGETGAQFQARCTKMALDHYWQGKE